MKNLKSLLAGKNNDVQFGRFHVKVGRVEGADGNVAIQFYTYGNETYTRFNINVSKETALQIAERFCRMYVNVHEEVIEAGGSLEDVYIEGKSNVNDKVCRKVVSRNGSVKVTIINSYNMNIMTFKFEENDRTPVQYAIAVEDFNAQDQRYRFMEMIKNA